MKRILLLFAALLFSFGVYSQIQTPQPSPAQKVEQKVGLTDVTLDYSRPSMRGRAIYGNLVPFDRMWRTGANANSIISFSHDVEIGGNQVPAGSYAIFTKPGVSNWEVYFYNDINSWGLPEKWNDKNVVAQVKVPTVPLTIDTETFTLSLDDITNDSAILGIQWAKTYVGIPLKFPTDKIVSANINRAMSGPSSNDYYAAAMYYFESGKDIQQSKAWMDKAMDMNENPMFYHLRQKSLIYAKAGDMKGAIEAAQQSLELAKKAGSDDYVALNTKSLKEWGAM